jgi:hypothetical protein
MPRLRYPILAATLASLLISTVAVAAKPATTCPAAASGYFVVDVGQWWDNTVAGFEAEGIDVYEEDGVTFTAAFDELAASLGLGDGAGLETFVKVDQWAEIDKNENGYSCMKVRPHTPGNPAYLFNGVDDQSSAGSGPTA